MQTKFLYIRTLFFLLFLTFYGITSYAQLKNLGAPKILVGIKKEEVINYFNELNSLNPNPLKKVDKEYDNEGNLTLSVSFSLDEEKYYNCLDMKVSFTTTQGGTSICDSQSIVFSNDCADININQLNKYFTKFNGNEWRFDYSSKLYIKGKLTKSEKMYGILYYFSNKE
jgi:hypothetical protein